MSNSVVITTDRVQERPSKKQKGEDEEREKNDETIREQGAHNQHQQQQWNQLPRDCIYSILPFLTLNELTCTSVLLSHQWYTAAQTLRRSQKVEEAPFVFQSHWSHRLLFASSLRHHVQHIDSQKWLCDINASKSNQVSTEEEEKLILKKEEQERLKHGRMHMANTSQRVRSIITPLEQITSHLPQLVSLRLDARIEKFHELESFPSKGVFPSALQSLSLGLDFAEMYFDSSVWQYVEHVFELVSQQLAHSLIVFRCHVQEEPDSETDSDEEGDGSRTSTVFSAKILRHLAVMRELRILDLSTHCHIHYLPSGIDCLRAIPQLTELVSRTFAYPKQLPLLLRAPLQQKYTRCGTLYLNAFGKKLVCDDWVYATLGRTLTYLDVHFDSLDVAARILPHFTQLRHIKVEFQLYHDHSNLNAQEFVAAFGSSLAHTEQLTLNITKNPFSRASLATATALPRILEKAPQLTQLTLSTLLTDLSFLNEIPQITRQLISLTLDCRALTPNSYRNTLTPSSFPALSTLRIITQIENLPTLDTMFRPVNQLQPAYHTKESSKQLARELETRALKDPPGIVECTAGTIHRVPLPSLRQLILDTFLPLNLIDEHRHALKVIDQVDEEKRNTTAFQ